MMITGAVRVSKRLSEFESRADREHTHAEAGIVRFW